MRANNLEKGYAFEFNATKGPVVGLISASGSGGDGVKPFVTNATGVATGLNADRVDGQHAGDLVNAAVAAAGKDAQAKVDAAVGAARLKGEPGAEGEPGADGAKGADGRTKAFFSRKSAVTTVNALDQVIVGVALSAPGSSLLQGQVQATYAGGGVRDAECSLRRLGDPAPLEDAKATIPGSGSNTTLPLQAVVTVANASIVQLWCSGTNANRATTRMRLLLPPLSLGVVEGR